MYAAYAGQRETVEILLNSGANANMKTPDGATALMAASLAGHNSVVRLLIARKADASIKNSKGLTALTIAEAKGHKEIIRIIRNALGIDKKLIREVQLLLYRVGFDPGPADGILGKRTKSAILAYQRQAGITVDGEISNALTQSLRSATPKPRVNSALVSFVGEWYRSNIDTEYDTWSDGYCTGWGGFFISINFENSTITDSSIVGRFTAQEFYQVYGIVPPERGNGYDETKGRNCLIGNVKKKDIVRHRKIKVQSTEIPELFQATYTTLYCEGKGVSADICKKGKTDTAQYKIVSNDEFRLIEDDGTYVSYKRIRNRNVFEQWKNELVAYDREQRVIFRNTLKKLVGRWTGLEVIYVPGFAPLEAWYTFDVKNSGIKNDRIFGIYEFKDEDEGYVIGGSVEITYREDTRTFIAKSIDQRCSGDCEGYFEKGTINFYLLKLISAKKLKDIKNDTTYRKY